MAIVNGGPGDNILNGFDNEADVLSGFDGNDWLRPKTHVIGGAPDQVIGGNHTIADTIEVDASGETQAVTFRITGVTSVSDRYNVVVSEVERMVYTGGSANDIFHLVGAQGGIVNGNGGFDSFNADLSYLVTPLNFTLNTNNMTLAGFQIFNMEVVALTSGSGDDRLTGGPFTDLLNGGLGNDTFIWTGGGDVFDGGAGIDTVDYTAYSEGVTASLTNGRAIGITNGSIGIFYSIEIIIGGAGNDDLIGDGFSNGLSGGRGDDELIGRSGDDILRGGLGHDDLYGELGHDRLEGGDNEDTLVGGVGKDTLLGGNHNDIMQGGLHSDVIIGGSGFDRVSYTDFKSSVKIDLVSGKGVHSGGADTLRTVEGIYTGSGNDQIYGNSVRNILDGGRGNNTIDGRGGNDLIWGDRDRDTLRGGDHNDDIYGMDGRDIITGGLGRDRLFGNYTGDDFDKDYFVYLSYKDSPRGSGRDIIEQFGKTDVIDLSRVVSGKFDYIGASGFSGDGPEVRVADNGKISGVAADINGDGRADLEILVDFIGLKSSNFLL